MGSKIPSKAIGDNQQLKLKTGIELSQYLGDPQSLNSYSYARNNPLTNLDPDGKSWKTFGQGVVSPFVYAYNHSFQTAGVIAVTTAAVLLAPVTVAVAGAAIGGYAIGTSGYNAFTAPDGDTRDYYLGQGTTAFGLTALGIKGASNLNSSVFGANGSTNYIKSVLQPNGELIGTAGTNDAIRVLQGNVTDAQKMFGNLTKGGEVITNSSYKGTLMKVDNGFVGIRSIQTNSPNTASTIDVNVTGVSVSKIKFNP